MSTPDKELPLEPAEWVARQKARQTVALAKLAAIDTRLQAGNGAWDNATPAQRTAAMRDIVAVLTRIVIELVDSDG